MRHCLYFYLFAIALASCDSNTSPSNNTQLSATPSGIAFGSVDTGTTASRQLILTNTGTASLTITAFSITGTGGASYTLSVPALPPKTMQPNEALNTTIDFLPQTIGQHHAALLILMSAGSPLTVSLDGEGKAPTGGGLQTGQLKATISDGGNFSASNAVAISGTLTFNIFATVKAFGTASDSVKMNLFIPKQNNFPYTVTVSGDENALIDYCIVGAGGICNSFRTDKTNGSGTITVEKLENNIIEGTFSATLAGIPPMTGTKTITNGQFKASF